MSTTTLAAAPTGFRPEHEETRPHATQCPPPWSGGAGATEIPGERMARSAPEWDADRDFAPGADPHREGQALAPLNWNDPDLGASTAEYAVIVLAAAAFGGVMAAVLSSDSVSGMLLGIIQKALSF
ncbi:DUF4244 domain-containing protein [Kocuria tytonicola]|uniref:DUF4244 domain-containing protein n=1 Tax=Kocuria tytonicola TaxID=2055946 RepID=UPI000EF8B811|nr:DUF4244 domain-containing protein [Kocuria tytonicola]RLZ03849.1 DUF4244 domain-containing protein [Kocuria tytonicola]